MVKKLSLDLTDEQEKDLNDLKSRAGVSSLKELFDNALSTFKWAIETRENGQLIASIDEQAQTYRELQQPVLAAIQSKP